MSIGFFLDDNAPVMWRGPMLHRALEQFLPDVHWGELDVLVVDMPPGTGDVSISLGQLLPRAEAVVVTTPQPVAQEVAGRAARDGAEDGHAAARRGREHDAARSSAPAAASGSPSELGVPLLGSVPLDARLRESATPARRSCSATRTREPARAIAEIAERVARPRRAARSSSRSRSSPERGRRRASSTSSTRYAARACEALARLDFADGRDLAARSSPGTAASRIECADASTRAERRRRRGLTMLPAAPVRCDGVAGPRAVAAAARRRRRSPRSTSAPRRARRTSSRRLQAVAEPLPRRSRIVAALGTSARSPTASWLGRGTRRLADGEPRRSDDRGTSPRRLEPSRLGGPKLTRRRTVALDRESRSSDGRAVAPTSRSGTRCTFEDVRSRALGFARARSRAARGPFHDAERARQARARLLADRLARDARARPRPRRAGVREPTASSAGTAAARSATSTLAAIVRRRSSRRRPSARGSSSRFGCFPTGVLGYWVAPARRRRARRRADGDVAAAARAIPTAARRSPGRTRSRSRFRAPTARRSSATSRWGASPTATCSPGGADRGRARPVRRRAGAQGVRARRRTAAPRRLRSVGRRLRRRAARRAPEADPCRRCGRVARRAPAHGRVRSIREAAARRRIGSKSGVRRGAARASRGVGSRRAVRRCSSASSALARPAPRRRRGCRGATALPGCSRSPSSKTSTASAQRSALAAARSRRRTCTPTATTRTAAPGSPPTASDRRPVLRRATRRAARRVARRRRACPAGASTLLAVERERRAAADDDVDLLVCPRRRRARRAPRRCARRPRSPV